MAVYYIDRKTGEKKKEIIAGEKFLQWVNNSKTGNTLLEIIIKRKVFSSLYGKLQDTRLSRGKIRRFIDELQIDMSEAERENIEDYLTFNDFFTRRLKVESRPIPFEKDILISPADGKILAYEEININKLVQIKGSHYTLIELFGDSNLSSEYNEGTCIVVRLSPADYHRFHFPDSGIPDKSKKIKGNYYSVNPLTLKNVVKVYCRNKREITLFQSDNFGKIAIVEVGATCVGSIIQTYTPNVHVKKGQEKGYFKFGGSTVIMFLKKGIVKIDNDILENTAKGFETKVNMGEKIGIQCN